MSDDFDEFDWGDDPFGGDVEFNDDFDSPSSKKGFIRSLATGFLSGVVDSTVGDTDARVKTLQKVLPKSYGGFFTGVRKFQRAKDEYIKLAKAESVGLVEDLQFFASKAAEKAGSKLPNRISSSLIKFSEHDFSSWKPYKPDSSDDLKIEGVEESEIVDLINTTDANSILEREAIKDSTLKTTSAITAVGGRSIASLDNIGSNLLRNNLLLEQLVKHQIEVKGRTDALQLSILTRTYLTNVKFYKFVESSNHRLVKELKDISTYSKMSDYEKTTHSQALKKNIREGIFGTMMSPFGGVKETFDNFFKNALPSFLGDAAGMSSMARMGLEMSDGMPINYGEMIGGMLGSTLVNKLPELAKTQQGRRIINSLKGLSPELTKAISEGYERVDDLGNSASLLVGGFEEIINRAAANRGFNFEIDEDYDTYVDRMEENGETPMGKIVWNALRYGKKGLKAATDKLLDNVHMGDPGSVNLKTRDLMEITETFYWTKQSDITLNEIIPRWLSEIHLSMEKLRTGDDSLGALSYDIVNSKFVRPEKRIAKTVGDVLNKSDFSYTASRAKRAVEAFDEEGTLSEAAKEELAFRLLEAGNKGVGFDPFEYLNLQDKGVDRKVAAEIRNHIKKTLLISDSDIAKYEDSSDLDRIMTQVYLPTAEGRKKTVGLNDVVKSLKGSIPNVAKAIDVAKATGDYQTLLDSGIIQKTEYGTDKVQDNLIWDVLRGHIRDENFDARSILQGREIENQLGTTLSTRRFLPATGPTHEELSSDSALIKAIEEGLGPIKGLDENIKALTSQMSGLSKLSEINLDVTPIVTGMSALEEVAREILTGNEARNETLIKILERQPTKKGKSSLGLGKEKQDEEEVAEAKKGIIARIKNFSFKDTFNKGFDKLLDAEPLVLGGLLGGLATTAFFSPKAGMLIAGGAAAAHLYGKYSALAKSRFAADDQDLYEEGSDEPILYAQLLRERKYYDLFSKKIIESWNDIKGGVVDTTTNAVISAKKLAGKLFTAENKEVFLKGLNKFRETMVNLYKKIDPFGKMKRLGEAGLQRIYQMDVYVNGENAPRLTGFGFKQGRYFVRGAEGELTPIKGWNEIDGAVFNANGEAIITEEDYQSGLITSAGVSVNKAGALLKRAGLGGKNLLTKLGKATGRGLVKGKEHVKDVFKTDFTPVVNAVDRIYGLMLKHWGYEDNTFTSPEAGDEAALNSIHSPEGKDERLNSKDDAEAKAKAAKEYADLQAKGKAEGKGRRLGSLEDQVEKAKEEKRERFMDSAIKFFSGGGGEGDDKEEKKEKGPGLFGMLASGFGMLKTFGAGLMGFLTGPLLTGVTWMAKFATMGLKLFPLMLKGITTIGALLARGGSKALDYILPSRRAKRGPLTRMGGLKTAGVGLGLGLAGTAMANMGVIEEGGMVDTGLGWAGTAATAYGAAQFIAPGATAAATSAVTGGLGAAASWAGAGLASLGSSLLTGAGAVASGAAAVLSSPVVIGAVVAGGLGYGIYRFVTRGAGKQTDLRMLQYGIKDPDSKLADKVRGVEDKLKDYITIEKGKASFRQSAPIEEIAKTFIKNTEDRNEVNIFFQWFNGRFKPIFLTYMSICNSAGIKSLEDYDSLKEWSVYDVAKQAHETFMSMEPRPYEVPVSVDSDYKHLPLANLLPKIDKLLAQLKKYLKRKTPKVKEPEVMDTYQDPEAKAAELEAKIAEQESGVWNNSFNPFSSKSKIEKELKEAKAEADKLSKIYSTDKPLGRIDITDLLEDGKDIDLLTAMRLEAYGNTESIPWRVEAVLKLERYCESLFTLRGTEFVFVGKVGEIYAMFQEAFRSDKGHADEWCLWFRDRFIPVLTVYINSLHTFRRGKPASVWKTLTATARYSIAKDLLEAKAKLRDRRVVSVYKLRYSPFKKARSGSGVKNSKAILAKMERIASQAKIKAPYEEEKLTNRESYEASQPKEPTTPPSERIEEERHKEETLKNANEGVEDSGAGETKPKGEGVIDKGGNTATAGGSTINPDDYNVPDTGDHTPVQIPDSLDGVNLSGIKVNGKNGADRGISIPPDVGRQLILREMVKAGFSDPREIAFQMANVDVESGGYKSTAEGFNYTSVANMRRANIGAWNSKSDSELEAIRQMPHEKIAETAYGYTTRKGRELENNNPGDGWNYRGRGLTQTTGKTNYKALSRAIGVDVVSNPRLVSDDPEIAVKSAVDYYRQRVRKRALRGGEFNLQAAIDAVGKGTAGNDRKVSLYKKYLTQIQNGTFKVGDKSLGELKEERDNPTTSTEKTSTEPDATVSTPTPTVEEKTAESTSSTPAPVTPPKAPTLEEKLSKEAPSNTPIAPAPRETPATTKPVETPAPAPKKAPELMSDPMVASKPEVKPEPKPTPQPKPESESVQVETPVVSKEVGSKIDNMSESISKALQSTGAAQATLLKGVYEELVKLNQNMNSGSIPRVRVN